MPWTLLARDAALLLGSAGLFQLADAFWQRVGGAAAAAAVPAGVLTGLVWGYLLHEWGHFAGARLAGARIQPAGSLASLKLFAFRSDHNDRRAFLWLSAGGFGGLWLQAAGFAWLLPWTTPAGASAVLFAVAGAVFTTWIEAPIAWRVARGGPLPGARAA